MRVSGGLRAILLIAAIVAAVVPSGGCGLFGRGPHDAGGRPVKAAPVIDVVNVRADAELNECDETGSHTVSMRIYSLRDPAAFQGATFTELWRNDKLTLVDDLLSVSSKHVQPGDTLRIELPREEDATALGVVVDFCRHEGKCWRWTASLAKAPAVVELDLKSTCGTLTVK